MRATLFVTSVALALAAGARAGETPGAEETPARDPIAAIRAIAAADDQVMAHLDHLTNKIGPRLTGSSNIEKAYEWTRSQFESFGLEKARLETWGEYAVGFDRGPSSAKLI